MISPSERMFNTKCSAERINEDLQVRIGKTMTTVIAGQDASRVFIKGKPIEFKAAGHYISGMVTSVTRSPCGTRFVVMIRTREVRKL